MKNRFRAAEGAANPLAFVISVELQMATASVARAHLEMGTRFPREAQVALNGVASRIGIEKLLELKPTALTPLCR